MDSITTLQLDTANYPSPFTLQWKHIEDLVFAGLNVRFCTSEDIARGIMTNGSTGAVDWLAFMGGFPYVVGKALPLEATKDKITNESVHTELYNYIDAWVLSRNNKTWGFINSILKSFSVDEQNKIIKVVQEELFIFFAALSDKKDKVWLIYPKAFDCKRYDADGYSSFGKAGGAPLRKGDFYSFSDVVASSGQASFVADVPRRLLWAFVEQALNVCIYDQSVTADKPGTQ